MRRLVLALEYDLAEEDGAGNGERVDEVDKGEGGVLEGEVDEVVPQDGDQRDAEVDVPGGADGQEAEAERMAGL